MGVRRMGRTAVCRIPGDHGLPSSNSKHVTGLSGLRSGASPVPLAGGMRRNKT